VKYALIKYRHKVGERAPSHWLTPGTLVRVLRKCETGAYEVETMFPVFGSPAHVFDNTYQVRRQHVRRIDYIKMPGYLGPFIEPTALYFRKAREFFGVA
jgi:hypothetical protein